MLCLDCFSRSGFYSFSSMMLLIKKCWKPLFLKIATKKCSTTKKDAPCASGYWDWLYILFFPETEKFTAKNVLAKHLEKPHRLSTRVISLVYTVWHSDLDDSNHISFHFFPWSNDLIYLHKVFLLNVVKLIMQQ